jgi:hypothetical protein
MDEFSDVIDTILNSYTRRWPGNIIDLVFVAIEQNQYYLKRYHEFADGDYRHDEFDDRAVCERFYRHASRILRLDFVGSSTSPYFVSVKVWKQQGELADP